MHKIARAALGAAMLVSTMGAAAEVAFAQGAEDDSIAALQQRAQIDQEMADLPGVFVAAPPAGVLGAQARRDNLSPDAYLDMLRALGERADMDRGHAEAPR